MDRVQWVSILGSAGLLVVVFELVRSRRLQEEYSLLWLFTGGVLLLLSCWRGLLDRMAQATGIHYPPSALFLVGLGFLLVILLHFSVIISDLSERTKKLAQEVALLREEQRARRPEDG
jgi:hypothetical protein